MVSLSPLILAVAIAQSAPAPAANFSGTWILDAARSHAVRAGGAIERGPIAITQNEAALTIVPLSGETETVTSVMADPKTEQRLPAEASKSYWDGSALVTERWRELNGMTVGIKKMRTLAASGSEMIVDTTVTYHHGYTPGVEGSPQAFSRDIYVRTKR